MATSNVSLTSDWASLSDYISVDAFNKLKTDIVNVAESRGMMVNNNGTIKNTLTNANVTVPANKTAGEKVLLSDVTDLQKLAKDTVAYHKDKTISNSKNTGTITVKNPQVYNDESVYTFGKNVFKNISINTTVSVKYKMYYTNGIQEYTTTEKTVLLQPIKGLK